MENSGLSLAESGYARKRREIFNFVKDLRALGADTDIGIPQIAVIGAQSAGKSSLVEAVTGISVPRDSGTCTRCPMECTILTTTGNWNCQISYRRGDHTSKSFSPLLTAKTDVDIWIRRAQAAILSPHADADSFKAMDYQQLKDLPNDERTLQFSKDVVVVDIEDPEGTDLSFIDLPGLMQNEDQSMIDLVQGLVEHYIHNESTVIIVTIPATDDMENQQAVRLARAADPDGERTIAVVTKPDSLSAGATGARQRWLDIVLGKSKKSYQLKLGYFVVRLPDDAERARNPTRKHLEKRAKEFFDSHTPWNNPLLSGHLGVPHFIDHISRVLMKIIQDSLPKLKEQVQVKLAECIQEMSKLPAEVTVDATTEILSRISGFCADLRGGVYGINESKTFVHRTQSAFKTFELAIRSSAPDFRPFTDPSAYLCPSLSVSGSYDPDENSEPSELDENFETDPIGLDEVRTVIKESIGWELPHNVPFEAKKRLIKRFIDQWPAPAQSCFDEVLHILSAFVDANIRKHFEQFPALEQYLGPIIRNEIVKCSKDGWRSVASVLECEKVPYMTQNGHYLESSRTTWLAHYRRIRHNPEKYSMNWQSSQPVASPNGPSISYGVRAADPPSPYIPPVDQYEEELIVMADVRAYFQVAYKRVIDHVPMTVQRHLNQELSDGLQTQLVAKLGLGSPDTSQRLADLLAEDPMVNALRAQLQAKKNRLEDMQVKLDNFVI